MRLGARTPTAIGDRASPGHWLKLSILALVIAGGALVAWRLGFFGLRHPTELAAAVRHARTLRGIGAIFVLTYAVVASLGLPAAPLTLAGGAIFGTVLGATLTWVGAVLGAMGAYALARMLGHAAIHGLIGRWFGKVTPLGGDHGFATLLRLRLLPVVPFNALSYAAGLVGAPFRAYVGATALGIIPGTIIYSYFADRLIAGAAGASRAAFLQLSIAAVLLLLLSFVPWAVRRTRAQRSAAS